MANKTNRENAKLLTNRINNGDIDQYFNLGDDEIRDISVARSEDNFEEMATILINNFSKGGEGFEPAVNSAYDSEVEQIVDRIIDDYVTGIELRSISAFKTSDIGNIRNLIAEVELFTPSSGFRNRKRGILNQLEDAEIKLSKPKNIKRIAVNLVKKRGKDPNDIKTTRLIKEWGRWKKKALVTWGRKGILAVKFLDESLPKTKKVKLKYIQTKKALVGKTTRQIISKKGQKFSLKERFFVKSRKNKTDDDIYDDYVRIFDKIRPKSEVISLIKLANSK